MSSNGNDAHRMNFDDGVIGNNNDCPQASFVKEEEDAGSGCALSSPLLFESFTSRGLSVQQNGGGTRRQRFIRE